MKLNQIHKFNYQVGYDNIDMYSVLYHPEYIKLCDKARNKSFEHFGYSVAEQLKDKIGFTIAGIKCHYNSPILMGEKLSIFTKCVEAKTNRCKVLHYITLETEDLIDTDIENAMEKILFSAEYALVLVSIEKINDYPLTRSNIKNLEVIKFNERIQKNFNFEIIL